MAKKSLTFHENDFSHIPINTPAAQLWPSCKVVNFIEWKQIINDINVRCFSAGFRKREEQFLQTLEEKLLGAFDVHIETIISTMKLLLIAWLCGLHGQKRPLSSVMLGEQNSLNADAVNGRQTFRKICGLLCTQNVWHTVCGCLRVYQRLYDSRRCRRILKDSKFRWQCSCRSVG